MDSFDRLISQMTPRALLHRQVDVDTPQDTPVPLKPQTRGETSARKSRGGGTAEKDKRSERSLRRSKANEANDTFNVSEVRGGDQTYANLTAMDSDESSIDESVPVLRTRKRTRGEQPEAIELGSVISQLTSKPPRHPNKKKKTADTGGKPGETRTGAKPVRYSLQDQTLGANKTYANLSTSTIDSSSDSIDIDTQKFSQRSNKKMSVLLPRIDTGKSAQKNKAGSQKEGESSEQSPEKSGKSSEHSPLRPEKSSRSPTKTVKSSARSPRKATIDRNESLSVSKLSNITQDLSNISNVTDKTYDFVDESFENAQSSARQKFSRASQSKEMKLNLTAILDTLKLKPKEDKGDDIEEEIETDDIVENIENLIPSEEAEDIGERSGLKSSIRASPRTKIATKMSPSAKITPKKTPKSTPSAKTTPKTTPSAKTRSGTPDLENLAATPRSKSKNRSPGRDTPSPARLKSLRSNTMSPRIHTPSPRANRALQRAQTASPRPRTPPSGAKRTPRSTRASEGPGSPGAKQSLSLDVLPRRSKTPSPELSPGTKSKSQKSMSVSPGTKTRSPGTKSPSPGTKTRSPGTKSPSPGTKTRSPGTKSPSPGTKSRSPGTKSPSPGTKTAKSPSVSPTKPLKSRSPSPFKLQLSPPEIVDDEGEDEGVEGGESAPLPPPPSFRDPRGDNEVIRSSFSSDDSPVKLGQEISNVLNFLEEGEEEEEEEREGEEKEGEEREGEEGEGEEEREGERISPGKRRIDELAEDWAESPENSPRKSPRKSVASESPRKSSVSERGSPGKSPRKSEGSERGSPRKSDSLRKSPRKSDVTSEKGSPKQSSVSERGSPRKSSGGSARGSPRGSPRKSDATTERESRSGFSRGTRGSFSETLATVSTPDSTPVRNLMPQLSSSEERKKMGREVEGGKEGNREIEEDREIMTNVEVHREREEEKGEEEREERIIDIDEGEETDEFNEEEFERTLVSLGHAEEEEEEEGEGGVDEEDEREEVDEREGEEVDDRPVEAEVEEGDSESEDELDLLPVVIRRSMGRREEVNTEIRNETLMNVSVGEVPDQAQAEGEGSTAESSKIEAGTSRDVGASKKQLTMREFLQNLTKKQLRTPAVDAPVRASVADMMRRMQEVGKAKEVAKTPKKAVKKARKPQSVGCLSRSITQEAFTHFARCRVNSGAIKEVMATCEKFWGNFHQDLMALGASNPGKEFSAENMAKLFKRQGFASTQEELNALVQKHLPQEHWQYFMSTAYANGNVFPTNVKKLLPDA